MCVADHNAPIPYMDCSVLEQQIDEAAVDTLVKTINIPPRPSLVEDLQREMREEDPDMRRIAAIASKDVALTAAVIRVINSPLYGLSRRVETLEQAVNFIGLRQVSSLVTGLVARQSIKGDGPTLTRFWDVSTKRAHAVMFLAKRLRGIDPDAAQTFGLFCDVGIPLLMQRFTDYLETLQLANAAENKRFVEVEQERHQTDHALVGALMARAWGLSQTVALSIRLHHDYSVLQDESVPTAVRNLVAYGLLAEYAIQRDSGLNRTVEWVKGGGSVQAYLNLSDEELADICDDIRDGFSEAG